MSARSAADEVHARRVPLPFPGARAFRRTEAYLFFGRAAQARDVRAHWLSDRITVLSGPVAVGKTSLLQAGVLPTIGPEDADVLAVGRISPPRVPGTRHLATTSYTAELLRSWRGNDTGRSTRIETVTDFIAEQRGAREGREEARLILACIDQLEELSDQPSGIVAGDQFLDEISMAVEAVPGVHLLVLIRQDAVRVLADHKRFSELRPRYLELRPLDAAGALEAIVNPAQLAGVPFASGIPQRLVKDLQTVTFSDAISSTDTVYRNDVEPLHLQVACHSLWGSLAAKADVITGERLQAWGGVDKAMSDFYNAAVIQVAADSKTGEGRLRDWLRLTFITQLGTRDTVQETSLALSEIAPEVIAALVDRRILTAEHRGGAVWYQLSHDRLAYAVLTANRAYLKSRGAERAGQHDPTPTGDSLHASAEAALRDGDLAAAERDIDEAVGMFRAAGNWRRIGDAQVLGARIARARDDLAGAERNLREALSIYYVLEDRYAAARALSAIGELHHLAGDYTQAAELNRNAVERMPGDVTALTGLGYAQWQGGSPADAEATFGQALRWNSNAPMALAGRGQVRADLGRYDYALDDLDRALQLELTPAAEADARSARALALAGLGRVAEAEAELAIAVQLAPDRPQGRLRAGRIAAILGHLDGARAEIEQILTSRSALSPVERESARRILESLR